jgi:hypothetical protein
MPGQNERNCQIRMPSSLWNHLGEIAQELGHRDARGHHSPLIREMISAAVAKWMHSPYVCRSARHSVLVTEQGDIFYRQVQVLHLNSARKKLPCVVEMKPEKRDYYHQRYRELRKSQKGSEGLNKAPDEFEWFQSQWLFNHFAAWNGRKEARDINSFRERPLGEEADAVGTTYKSADLEVESMAGRFLTREIVVGLRDYVQWKEPNASPDTPTFDRIDIPIDIPTTDLQICVVVDKRLFASMGVESEAIANLSLEFRNRESARFEGKDVAAWYPEIGFSDQFGRSIDDEGADEALRDIAALRGRVAAILEGAAGEGLLAARSANKAAIVSSLKKPPTDFLFYWLRWPAPHLGIEVCVRWEKPVKLA